MRFVNNARLSCLVISARGRRTVTLGDSIGVWGGATTVFQRAHRVLAQPSAAGVRGDHGQLAAHRAGQREPQRRLLLHPVKLAQEKRPLTRA